MEENDQVELTDLDEVIIDAQKHLHKEAVTRREACREKERVQQSRGES